MLLLAVNDVKNAAPCAASYMLFDPKDQVMKQNVEYYRFYREQWGLEESDFLPRPVSQTKTSLFCRLVKEIRKSSCIKWFSTQFYRGYEQQQQKINGDSNSTLL